MPKFQTVDIGELKKTIGISPERMKKLDEYMKHISKLTPAMGCKITCDKGESINAVRNNIKKAAEVLGKKVSTRRSGNVIAVYLSEGKKRGRKPGSRLKS